MIVLQFAQGTDLGAAAIEWFGGGPRWSHVDSVLPDGTLLGARSDVVMGVPAGVQIRPASYLGNEKTLRVELDCAQPIADAYYAFQRAQLGKPYDPEGIVGFIVGRDWRDPSAWFCSEEVAAGLEQCEFFRYPLGAAANKITPPDLVLVLSAITRITIPE